MHRNAVTKIFHKKWKMHCVFRMFAEQSSGCILKRLFKTFRCILGVFHTTVLSNKFFRLFMACILRKWKILAKFTITREAIITVAMFCRWRTTWIYWTLNFTFYMTFQTVYFNLEKYFVNKYRLVSQDDSSSCIYFFLYRQMTIKSPFWFSCVYF